MFFERRSPGVGAGVRKGTAAAEETTALVIASDDLVLAAGDLREGVILLPGDALQLEHEAAFFDRRQAEVRIGDAYTGETLRVVRAAPLECYSLA
jgi:hypothetical protein